MAAERTAGRAVITRHDRFHIPREARRNRDTLSLDHGRLRLPAAHRHLRRHRLPGLHPDRRVRGGLRDRGIDQRRARAAGAETGERVEIGLREVADLKPLYWHFGVFFDDVGERFQFISSG